MFGGSLVCGFRFLLFQESLDALLLGGRHFVEDEDAAVFFVRREACVERVEDVREEVELERALDRSLGESGVRRAGAGSG